MSLIPPQTMRVNRQQLYEEVWSTPLCQVTARYGVSYEAMAYFCNKHHIPRPPSGYWSKKVAGKAPPTPPLPPCDDPALQTIEFTLSDPAAESPESLYEPDIVAMLDRARALPKVVVRDSMRGLHRLVRETQQWFDANKMDDQELIRGRQCRISYPLQVSVSRGLLRRAMLFLDALIRAIETVGGSVVTEGESHYPTTQVVLAGEKVTAIRLREKYSQVKAKPDPESRFSPRLIDYQPLGVLILDAGPSHFSGEHCRDSDKEQRIEDRINELVIRWVHTAGRMRMERRKQEETQRRNEEELRARKEQEAQLDKRREELKRLQEAEQARVDRLIGEAILWHTSQIVRGYIAAVRELGIRKQGSIKTGDEWDRWLIWAGQQADRLDPLPPSPPSILDEKI